MTTTAKMTFLFLSLALSLFLFPKAELKAATDSHLPSTVENAKTWTIDSKNSSVEFFAIGNPSMLSIEGKGQGPSGMIKLTRSGPEGTLTLDLSTLDSGIALRDEHLKEKYLEIQKGNGTFRNAEVSLTQFSLPEGESFLKEKVPFTGKLKLHGIERPIEGDVKIEKKGNTLKIDTQFPLKLSDYQIAIPNYAGITVGEEVKVTVHLQGTLSK